MRYSCIIAAVLLASAAPAVGQVSIGIGLPHVSIGMNVPMYPELVRVPNYPVYYAPQMQANFFFYDGMYWVYENNDWYASSWYNGPWSMVGPQYVPIYILRVPVRYYRHPPTYFRGWTRDDPPRWGQHWGREWDQQRSGWDRWDRNSAPRPAPLPDYQRQYSGNRYPQAHQQPVIHEQNYRYQPRDPEVRREYQQHSEQQRKAPESRPTEPSKQQSQDRDKQQAQQQQSQDRQQQQQKQQAQQQQSRDREQQQKQQAQQQQSRDREQQQKQQAQQQQQQPPSASGQEKGAQSAQGSDKAKGKGKPKPNDTEGEQQPNAGGHP
jgi:hypothetical protein